MQRAVEFDIFAFVEMRFGELGIGEDPHRLFVEATALRSTMAGHQRLKLTAVSVSGVLGVVGAGALLEQIRTQAFDAVAVGLCILLIAGATVAMRFWLHSERQRRFPEWVADHAPYEIESAKTLARVFEPIRLGHAQLALIANSGPAIAFTPITNRPIERYIAGQALDDAWLPGEILHRRLDQVPADNLKQGHTPEYIVIIWQEVAEPKRAPDRWKRYYLWHLKPAYVETVFDRANSIYANDPLKRRKARFGLIFASKRLAECGGDARKFPSQPVLVKELKSHLNLEANRLQRTGEIDEREERMFENIGMSGRPKETDPAEPRSKLGDGADGWFEQLLSGLNQQICPALRVEVLRDYPTLYEFKNE